MKRLMIDLYEHNKTAYEKAEAMLDDVGRAAVIHPTGSGKSYIAFAMAEAHPNEKFLWIAPSEYIYALQTKKLLDAQGISLQNIEFHTYAWLMHNEDKFKGMNPYAIIFDEFHRAGAEEWGRSVRKLIDMYPHARLFGMSATNIRYLYEHRDMADELFMGSVASEMSLCEAFARGILPEPKYVISVYSYEERLNNIMNRASGLRNKRLRERSEMLIEKLRRALEEADGVDEMFRKHIPKSNAKMIIFCANVEHLEELTAKASDWFGGIDSNPHIYRVDAYTGSSEKEFAEFVEDKSEHLKLLYCIDMLNEGIHVEDVDAVVLCRPTVSPIIYRQQIGRAIAAGCAGRPVIFDMVNNFDSLYQIDGLKENLEEAMLMYAGETQNADAAIGFEIIDELANCRKLMEQIQRNLDVTWDEYFRELKDYIDKNSTIRIPKRHVSENGLCLGAWLIRQRMLYQEGNLSEARIRRLESLGITWEADSDERFTKWLDLLKKYRDEHGNVLISNDFEMEDGEKLGQWCQNARRLRRNNSISTERIEALDSIGFVWDVYDAYWEEGYSHAVEYHSEHRNLNIPKRYKCEDGYRLGLWISTQRRVSTGRISGNLTDEKKEKLTALGMKWSSTPKTTERMYIESLREYIDTHGNSLVPDTYVDNNGIRLGKWISRARWEYSRGSLSETKYEALRETGFTFGINCAWGRRYQEAKEYFDANGSLHIPMEYIKKNGGGLSTWIAAQRREYTKQGHGSLSGEQIKLLEEINIDTGTRASDSFNKGLEEFKAYVEKHGDNLVPSAYQTQDGYRLGRWVSRQRDRKKKGELPKEQEKALDEAGMEWESTESVRARRHWEEMYREALRYAKTHGSIRAVPNDYETDNGHKLGCWIARQRRIRKGTIQHSITLDENMISMLDEIGMNWGQTDN